MEISLKGEEITKDKIKEFLTKNIYYKDLSYEEGVYKIHTLKCDFILKDDEIIITSKVYKYYENIKCNDIKKLAISKDDRGRLMLGVDTYSSYYLFVYEGSIKFRKEVKEGIF